MSVGFVGIGTMGLAMAKRLLDAGVPLRVWNRTAAKCEPLVAHGATLACSIDEVFQQCRVVFLMLLHDEAVNSAVGRGTPAFMDRVKGRTVVTLGTTAPEYSEALGAEIRLAGGHYVESPVSGSRIPAEQGALIAMLAGDDDALNVVEPLLAPMCRTSVRCGAVPSALRTKLAVNHYLILLVSALAEAVAAATAIGVDLHILRKVLDEGPMASPVSRAKLEMLLSGDFSPQAAIRDVAQIAVLVRDQARAANVDATLIEVAAQLYVSARSRGLANLDMAAVLQPTAHTDAARS